MPANIFVPVVWVLSQNLGLAGFVALRIEKDDRNPRFLLEQPCLFTADAHKVLLQQGRSKEGSFLFGSVSFSVSAQTGSYVLVSSHENAPLHSSRRLSTVFSFIIVLHSLTHLYTSIQTSSCFTHNLHPGELLGLLSAPSLSALSLWSWAMLWAVTLIASVASKLKGTQLLFHLVLKSIKKIILTFTHPVFCDFHFSTSVHYFCLQADPHERQYFLS